MHAPLAGINHTIATIVVVSLRIARYSKSCVSGNLLSLSLG
jgi:hypothetical protein